MTAEPSSHPTAEIFCTRCPLAAATLRAPFTEPGRLAGHLVEMHGVGASAGLHEARQAFGIPGAAPRPRVAPAPAPTGTSGYLIQTKESAMPRKDAPKPKYKRPDYKCGACGSTKHTARSSECPKSAGFLERLVAPTVPKPKPFQMQDRGQARKGLAAQGGSAADLIRLEITKREREIAALKDTLTVLGG